MAKDNNNNQDPEIVSVPSSLLESMQAELASLREKVSSVENKVDSADNNAFLPTDEVTKRTARLRKLGDSIVIGYENTFQEVDEKTKERITKITLILLDKNQKEIKKSVVYSDFVNEAPEIEVDVISVNRKETTRVLGIIDEVEAVGSKMIKTGKRVQNKVVSFVETAEVRMPDGSTRMIDVNFLNI